MKFKFLYILLLIIIFPSVLNAKIEFRGKVTDMDGSLLPGIIIRLYEGDKTISFTSSKKNGTFTMKADTVSFPAKITFASRNHAQEEVFVSDANDSIFVTMIPQQYILEEVTVKAPKTRVKGDTIIYDVASYTSKGDRSIEDVIKKLPGVEVSESGAIFYDGEPINNFYIEGLNLMGSNYSVASRNIRPQDISSVSVYERHQPKKALKGVSDSKRAALNLKLKKGRMLRPVGHAEAAAGHGDEWLWSGKLYSMLISPKNQTILSASGNNRGTDAIGDKLSDHLPFSTLPLKPFGVPSIQKSRYIFNKTASFSANTLFKLKEDLNITVNSSYSLDHDSYSGTSSTEYLASDMENPVYSESVGNFLRKHFVAASAKIEKNADRVYFLDQFSFKGAFNNNAYDILNTEKIRERMGNDHYSFSNNLSAIIRNRRNVFEVKSFTSFNNTPSNHISASDPDTGETTLYQFVTGKSFHNNESAGYIWNAGRKYSAGIDMDFSFDHDSFQSAATVGGKEGDDNDLSGHRLILTASPFYKFTIPGKISFKFTLPVEWRNMRYTDLINGRVHRLDKPYLNPNLNFYFKFGRISDISASAGWKHDTGDMRDFIVNPIHTTFRNTTTLGNGTLVETLSKSASLTFSMRNPMEGHHLRAMLSYINRASNSVSAYNVDNEGTSGSSVNLNTKSNTTNLMITGVKAFRKCNTRLSLNLNGIWMGRESMRSSRLIDVNSSTYIATLGASTDQFNGLISLSSNVSYTFSHQSFGSLIPDNDLSELSVNGTLSVFPIKDIEIYGKIFFNRSQIADDNYKSNTFIDAGIRYRIRKFEIELSGRNLTDMRNYAYTIYRTLDIATYSYGLRPAEAVLSLRYSF